jgi:hypothetical protein
MNMIERNERGQPSTGGMAKRRAGYIDEGAPDAGWFYPPTEAR